MLKIHPKSGETWWRPGWARSWWYLVRSWEYGLDSIWTGFTTDHMGVWNRRVKVDWVSKNIYTALFHCLKSRIKYGKMVALFSIKVGGPWVCLLLSAPIGMSEIGDDSQCLRKREYQLGFITVYLNNHWKIPLFLKLFSVSTKMAK